MQRVAEGSTFSRARRTGTAAHSRPSVVSQVMVVVSQVTIVVSQVMVVVQHVMVVVLQVMVVVP
jgi:hypothetical protein